MKSKQTVNHESEQSLVKLKAMAQHMNVDVSEEIKSIENKIKLAKNETALLTAEKSQSHKQSPAWLSVEKARMKGRPTTLDYISEIFDGFLEFHGDRGFKDDDAIVGGVAMLNDQPFTVIGHQKGRDVHENVKRNFGMPHPEGYRKALRLMKQAEKFNRPILCLIDTPGAFCGLGAEERGQGEAIARNLVEMAQLTVPVISIVIGEGGSGGALALGIANKVYMLENAIYSVLSPEGFATILWKDSSRAAEAAALMKITGSDLLGFGIIDQLIPEFGESQIDLPKTAQAMKTLLISDMEELGTLSKEQLVDNRAAKYRHMGL